MLSFNSIDNQINSSLLKISSDFSSHIKQSRWPGMAQACPPLQPQLCSVSLISSYCSGHSVLPLSVIYQVSSCLGLCEKLLHMACTLNASSIYSNLRSSRDAAPLATLSKRATPLPCTYTHSDNFTNFALFGVFFMAHYMTWYHHLFKFLADRNLHYSTHSTSMATWS